MFVKVVVLYVKYREYFVYISIGWQFVYDNVLIGVWNHVKRIFK